MGVDHDQRSSTSQAQERAEYNSQEEGGKVAMSFSSSTLGKWMWGGQGHTPLLPQRSMGEIAVAFPPSFWTTLPYFPRGHGRNHNGLPTLLLNMV